MRRNFYAILLLCPLLFCLFFQSKGQIRGKVYLDSNANTEKDANEKGLKNIRVTAYNSKGKIVKETQTDTSGSYLLNIAVGKRVRVEYSNLPEGLCSTPSNFQNGTLTQFITSSSNGINNVGVYYPPLYDNGLSRAVAVSYTIGSGKDTWGDTATTVSLFSAANPNVKRFTIAKKSDVGSIWGLAYDKNREVLYMSSFAKRHVAYGKLGTGGIYVMNFSTGTITPFLQASPELQIFTGEDKHIGLGGVFNEGNRFNNVDSLFFDEVGKTSYGGIDVSEDGNTLFVMNLYTRQLMQIAIPKGDNTLKASDITFHKIPEKNLSGGELRPFAVKVFGDKVFLGVVHDAFKSQKLNDLKAVVFELDVSTKEINEVFRMPLDYQKGYPEVGYTSRNGWYPWTKNFKKGLVPESSGNWAIYPQPILADIEFDTDGSMILGFMDRYGHQGATMAQTNDPSLYSVVECGGDIIRVALVKGKFVLEDNGKAGGVTTKGAGNNQGPGGGEYYFEDYFAPYESKIISEESASGGLALLPSTGELLASHREPLQYNWATQLQGVRYYNNQKGTYTRSIVLPSKGFQKANGAGDVELLMDIPGTEIGNRVWLDCDENGIQDPDEPAIKDVVVELYQNGQKIASTTTNASGEYIFNDNNILTENGLLQGNDYEIRISLNQPKYAGLQLTKTNAGNNPEIDNDATVEGTNAVVKTKLTGAGYNNYSLDFGFKCIEKPKAKFTVKCSGTDPQKDIKIKAKEFSPGDHYDIILGSTYEKDLDYLGAKILPENGLIYTGKIDPLVPNNYTVRIFNQNCYTDYVLNTIDDKECYQKAVVTQSVENETSLFSVYPNPASSIVEVTYKEYGSNNIQIELLDVQGVVIETKNVNSSGELGELFNTSFNVNNLITGTYLISVKGKKTVTKKFIKN